jgi:hypothetical protein
MGFAVPVINIILRVRAIANFLRVNITRYVVHFYFAVRKFMPTSLSEFDCGMHQNEPNKDDNHTPDTCKKVWPPEVVGRCRLS